MSVASDSDKRAIQWQFIRQDPGWTWRKMLADGTLDRVSAGEFPDYAFAINDAINQGFRPRRDYWVIITENGTTHFRSGQPPAFVPRKDGTPFPPPAASRRATRKPDGGALPSKSGAEC